uniref:Uncharacterized protein n=1 Tax=Anopheles merus TaxID=30066 RepID=A0A182VN15_ANOME
MPAASCLHNFYPWQRTERKRLGGKARETRGARCLRIELLNRTVFRHSSPIDLAISTEVPKSSTDEHSLMLRSYELRFRILLYLRVSVGIVDASSPPSDSFGGQHSDMLRAFLAFASGLSIGLADGCMAAPSPATSVLASFSTITFKWSQNESDSERSFFFLREFRFAFCSVLAFSASEPSFSSHSSADVAENASGCDDVSRSFSESLPSLTACSTGSPCSSRLVISMLISASAFTFAEAFVACRTTAMHRLSSSISFPNLLILSAMSSMIEYSTVSCSSGPAW